MSEAAQIDRFVRRLGWRHRWLSAARIALRLGLPIGCVAFVVAVVVPGHGLQVLVVGIALVLAVGAGTLATTRLRAARADTELALADRLPTWEEVRRQENLDPVAGWLGSDLATRVAGIDRDQIRSALPLRVGRIRYLIPLLVVLLMLQLFAPVALPGDLGLMLGSGGAHQGSGSASGTGNTPNQGGARGNRASPSEPQSRPRSQESRSRPESQASAPASLPIVSMRSRDEVVVPELVREGPSRKALAPLAELDIGPDSRGASADPNSAALAPEQAVRDPQAYRRAVERALVRRQVPLHERAFVRRYFEELAQRGH